MKFRWPGGSTRSPAPIATFGVDFYDENWQRIDGVFNVIGSSDQPQVVIIDSVVPPSEQHTQSYGFGVIACRVKT